MKYIWLITALCSLNTPSLYANIDEQIDAIKHASVKERFILMNKFKKNLIKMKEKERIEAIKKLSRKSNNKNAKMALDELEKQKKRNKMKKHLEYDHIDEDSFIDDQEGNNYD